MSAFWGRCGSKRQNRADDKYPVSIRVYWKGKSSYIGTEYYVTDKQINKKTFELKDVFILNELNKRIAKYEELKSHKLGFKIELYSAKELAKYFFDETKPGTDNTINFIEFARNYRSKLREKGKTSTAGIVNCTVNAIVDFCNGRENVAITEITAKFLEQFETFLRSERIMKRKNQFDRIVTTRQKGLSDVSVCDYMSNIRTLFNAAIAEYNDEDKGEIKILHYPFRKYKIKPAPENIKRNLTREQIQSIRDVSDELLMFDRTIFARDMFLLSFYLVGMNFADLYEIEKYKNGRLLYERKKTKGKRQDKAFISIKAEPEAVAIINKYRDKTGERVFDFHQRYTTSHIFSSNVNKGLKVVAEVCKIEEPVSTYYARHSWATIARNKCNVSKDDIDLALNHVDQGLKMADVYIEKDWTKIDAANRAVLDYIK